MNDERLERGLAALMAGDGPADLRERVLARITKNERRPRSVPLLWLGLAAAAVMVALYAHPWRDRAPAPAPRTTRLAGSVATSQLLAPAGLVAARPPRVPRAALPAVARAQAPNLAPLSVRPVEVVPLAEQRVDIETLAEARLVILPLSAITPLEPSSD